MLKNKSERTKLKQFLKINGIETKIHYPIPLHLQKCAENTSSYRSNIPNAQLFAKSMISLPIYPLLSDKEVDYIISTFNKIINEIGL